MNFLVIINTINAVITFMKNFKDIWDKSAELRNQLSEKNKQKKLKKIQIKRDKKLRKLAISQRINLIDDNNKE